MNERFDLRICVGETDGEGVVHAAQRLEYEFGNQYYAARCAFVFEWGLYRVVDDALVTCIPCVVKGLAR